MESWGKAQYFSPAQSLKFQEVQELIASRKFLFLFSSRINLFNANVVYRESIEMWGVCSRALNIAYLKSFALTKRNNSIQAITSCLIFNYQCLCVHITCGNLILSGRGLFNYRWSKGSRKHFPWVPLWVSDYERLMILDVVHMNAVSTLISSFMATWRKLHGVLLPFTFAATPCSAPHA